LTFAHDGTRFSFQNLCMILALAAAALAAASTHPMADEFRARDQALLDAIAPGRRADWEKALWSDAIYVDENGTVLNRAQFLKALVPLPKGASGHISIVDYQLQASGDVALVIHRDDEREDYHGIPLHADYLMTETWLRRGGQWRLALVHAYVVAEDPPAVAVPAARLDEYVGSYRAAADLTFTIRRQGDGLIGTSQSGRSSPLLVESPDVMFIAGQPRMRRIFQRDGAGHVTGFMDRREGEDIYWKREAPP
jgi:ketosteroid isomerase-like protein